MADSLPQLTKQEALGVAAVATVGLVALAGTLDLEVVADVAAITGFLVVLPLIAILDYRLPFVSPAGSADRQRQPTDASATEGGAGDTGDEDPVAKLRDRYARGEIGEEEFERKLDRLLETEGIDAESGSGRDRLTELE